MFQTAPLPEALLAALAGIPGMFFSDLARYLIAAGLVYLLVNSALTAWLRRRRIRDTRPHWRQLPREMPASLRSILVYSIVGLAILVPIHTGHSQLYMDVSERGWIWFAISLAILIIGHDAWFYWTHRLMHRPRFYKALHSLHHKSNNPTPWTAYAFNTGEAFIHALYLPVMFLLLPVPGLAAFVWGLHQIFRNAVGHSGYEIFPATRDGRPMFDWMTTVTHHDLHHARAGWNFGLYFTWWDRWMGTEHPDYHAEFARTVARTARARPQPGR